MSGLQYCSFSAYEIIKAAAFWRLRGLISLILWVLARVLHFHRKGKNEGKCITYTYLPL